MPLSVIEQIDSPELTAEDIAARVGAIPWRRIRTDPPPGTATEEDVERIRNQEDRICELIDGILVEKAVSDASSFVAGQIITLLTVFVTPRRLGWILATDGFVRLFGTQLRAPDASFVRRDQRPAGRLLSQGYADVAPALAVEVLSPGNTAREIERKRNEFFEAGTELFWVISLDRQEVVISTGTTEHRVLGRDDVLDGGTVLPGFSVKVSELFANIDLGSGEKS